MTDWRPNEERCLPPVARGVPRRPHVVMCDDGMLSGCKRQAHWWVSCAGGDYPMCDLHAEWYLRRADWEYPRRPT